MYKSTFHLPDWQLRHQRIALQVSCINLRQQRGLTQAQLAAKAGLQQTAISRFENSQTDPNMKTLFKIVHALDATIELKPAIINQT